MSQVTCRDIRQNPGLSSDYTKWRSDPTTETVLSAVGLLVEEKVLAPDDPRLSNVQVQAAYYNYAAGARWVLRMLRSIDADINVFPELIADYGAAELYPEMSETTRSMLKENPDG